jgi:hypothetical protein
MKSIEESIVKVYLLQRERLRERAQEMLERTPDPAVPSTWVVPMDVHAVDRVIGRPKPYLYYDRKRDHFTHLVHSFAVGGTTDPTALFPVQRVITIPEHLG